MPFLFLQRGILGKRKLEEILGQAQDIYKNNVIRIVDSKSSGTDGGGFTSSSYLTRDLTTIEEGSDYCTLASNQFTIVKGQYRINAHAPAVAVNRHKAILYNITDSSTEVVGTAEYTSSAATVQTFSIIKGSFTITDSKTFEIRHRCQTTRATDGFGIASSFGTDAEIYTIVELTKIA